MRQFSAEFRRAIDAFNANDLVKAEKILARIRKASHRHFEVEHLLGIIMLVQSRYSDALKYIGSALEIKRNDDQALSNYGYALKCLNRAEEALKYFTRSLAVNPRNAVTHQNIGTILADYNHNYLEALVQFEQAISFHPNFSDAYSSKGNCLEKLKRYDEAFAAYDRALSIKPDLAEAWLGRGNVSRDLKRPDEGFAAYDKALSIKPDLAEAWLGRGNVFCDLKHYDEAFAAYDKARSIKPHLAEAWLGRGNVSCDLKRYDEAFAAYDKAVSIKPDLEAAEGARLFARTSLCSWENLEAEIANLTTSIKLGKANSVPFVFLAFSNSPEDQLRCAKTWVATKHPQALKSVWRGTIYKHDKIRVGYVSADFRQHPVARVIAGVFECHDRSQFETTAISIGPNDNSEIRLRLEGSFDKFVDAWAISSADIAKKILEAEIDILIDLNGFTENARTEIFAHRPAPIQVSYLGYPGTMGSNYIDYVIADPTLIPASHQNSYAENVAYLPHSYLPHDNESRIISNGSLGRREFGLPDNGFIFCCFNNAYKYNPTVFRRWLKLLEAVDHSVLWLSENNTIAADNLKKEAIIAGVDPGRLVFAKRLPSAEDHLARYRLADIFLDTLPYNAHTTASDALWAGLPVLTQMGNTFAGRVAASLLSAIDLPELITHSRDEYEALAIELAHNREKLQAIREKLQRNRLTTPLFDTALYTKHLEAAYKAMYQRYQTGLPPDHIEVPPRAIAEIR
jgi:protein O-GlcNAc transferase